MDVSRLKPIKISSQARAKVICDLFPENASREDISSVEKHLSFKEAPIHAGALCLYATTLISKVYERNIDDLEPYYDERLESYKKLIKSLCF